MQKQRAASPFPVGYSSLLGLPFFLAGLFLSWVYFSGYVKYWSALSWIEVPCWIDTAALETSRHDSTTYKVACNYRYRYQGHLYQGSQVALGSGSDNIGRFQLQTYQELKRYADSREAKPDSISTLEDKKAFRCFVNPSNPESAVLYRSLRWEMQAFFAIFALTFPAVGAFLILRGFVQSKEQNREDALRARYPDQPWKWRPDWAGESIPEGNRFIKAAISIYTIWSGLVVLPLVATIAFGGFFTEPKALSVALLFFLLWCVPAWFSLKHLRQHLAVGSVRFDLLDAPVQPGGQLSGAAVFERSLAVSVRAEATLECRKQVTQRGGSEGSTTTQETIWSRSERVAVATLGDGPDQCRIPVHFTLPADAPQSAFEGSTEMQYGWKLTLKVPERAIQASFEIPVFRTKSLSPIEASTLCRVPSILDNASQDLPARLARRRILAAFDQSGHPVSLVCQPARNLGLVCFLLLFNVLWTGFSVFLIARQAPLLFRTVWPCSAVFLWGVLLWNVLHKRTATVHSSGVAVTNELFLFRWERSFQKSEISGFSSAVHMTSGTASFYRIQLSTVSGKKETLVDGITESTTAEALVGRLELWASQRSEPSALVPS